MAMKESESVADVIKRDVERLKGQIRRETDKLERKKAAGRNHRSDYMIIRSRRDIIAIESKIQSLQFRLEQKQTDLSKALAAERSN
ncbi:hypothetical protein ACFO4L_00225 [Bacillus daqingensis]|uniref:Uncharacterized protein n=1 Tax=Bacillus daqingensis TaxID=872396 RepID=A0ABV9NQQ5_9BACI